MTWPRAPDERHGPSADSTSVRRPWRARLLRFLPRLLLVYLTVVLVLMFFEEPLIFPAPRYPLGEWNPPGLAFEEVNFASEDGTPLHGWMFGHERPRGYLLYCHGNADFVPNLGHYAQGLRDRYRLSVFIFDYRGYGKSGGRPSEAGVLADARAARRWLAKAGGIAERDVLLLGRSLGGAVAVSLAADTGAKALVLENVFTSAPDVAAHHFPWFPVRLLMRTQLNALERIRHYDGPLLQCHAAEDEVVPLKLGKKLFAAAPGQKQFIVIRGARHNDPLPSSYYQTLGELLDRILPIADCGLRIAD